MAEEIEEHRRVSHPGGGESRTKQADAQDADINNLVARYMRTGQTRGTSELPRYGDFSSGLDFHAVLMRIREAQDQFMDLPAPVRRLCDNDPGKFLDMVFEETGEGLKHLVEAGFAPELAPPPEEEPVQVELVERKEPASGSAPPEQ